MGKENAATCSERDASTNRPIKGDIPMTDITEEEERELREFNRKLFNNAETEED